MRDQLHYTTYNSSKSQIKLMNQIAFTSLHINKFFPYHKLLVRTQSHASECHCALCHKIATSNCSDHFEKLNLDCFSRSSVLKMIAGEFVRFLLRKRIQIYIFVPFFFFAPPLVTIDLNIFLSSTPKLKNDHLSFSFTNTGFKKSWKKSGMARELLWHHEMAFQQQKFIMFRLLFILCY